MAFLTSGTTSSDSIEWQTPDTLYLPLHEKWDFTLDGAASHANTKCPRYCTVDGTYGPCPVRLDGEPTSDTDFGCGHVGHVQNRFGWAHLISEHDGLTFPWAGERVFLNSPWGEPEQPCGPKCSKKRCEERGWHAKVYIPGIVDFMRKTVNDVLRHGAIVSAVVPSRTDTDWFHRYVLPYRPQFKRGRPRFINPQTGLPGDAPPVGICIVEYR